jgi:signal transduction histidine kinase
LVSAFNEHSWDKRQNWRTSVAGILVVEDEAIVAKDISNTLKSLGYMVVAVTDRGEKALDLLATHGTDLVLMDIVLKGNLDGIETAQLIKTRFNLPVVFLTAHNDSATLQRAKITTPYGYILKPFEERELQTNIEMALYRHETERKLKTQSEELEKTRRFEALGTLAGGIAHEFNNLLTIIMGHLWLLEAITTPSPEIELSILETEEALKRARRLSRQLLSFAKGGEPLKTRVELNQLLKLVIEETVRNSKTLVVFELDNELWSFEADYDQLNDVIFYLVRHALEAMPDGGQLTIRTKNIVLPANGEISNTIYGQFVLFSITDEGKGIPAEEISGVFDPFSRTGDGHDSGMALAICYAVVKRHGGEIKVITELEKGTTFEVYFPADNVDTISESGDSSSLIPVTESAIPDRILVMDDEEAILSFLQSALVMSGYEVETVTDGLAAIEKYKVALQSGRQFGIVILDLVIPGGMGGLETIQALRVIDHQVKAIVSSGYSDDPIMANYTQYGFTGRLKKPYKVTDLLKQIEEIKQKR